MCVDLHQIYRLISSRRRELGLSQQEVAARAGMRREKINRMESQCAEVGLGELSKVLEVLGLSLSVGRMAIPGPVRASGQAPVNSHGLPPSDFKSASFFDGKKAKVVDWGKVPG